MLVEQTEFSAKPKTQEAVIARKTNFFGTSFTLTKTSKLHMAGFYKTNTFRLETKPDNRPPEIDVADNLTSMEQGLARQKAFAQKVQYLYVSLAGVAGLGAVFSLLASNLRETPQMTLALGLTAVTSIFYKKLDRALDITAKSNDKLNFLRRIGLS